MPGETTRAAAAGRQRVCCVCVACRARSQATLSCKAPRSHAHSAGRCGWAGGRPASRPPNAVGPGGGHVDAARVAQTLRHDQPLDLLGRRQPELGRTLPPEGAVREGPAERCSSGAAHEATEHRRNMCGMILDPQLCLTGSKARRCTLRAARGQGTPAQSAAGSCSSRAESTLHALRRAPSAAASPPSQSLPAPCPPAPRPRAGAQRPGPLLLPGDCRGGPRRRH